MAEQGNSVEVTKRPKKIKYNLIVDDNAPKYHSAVTRPGARSPWHESADNPLSPNFMPPEQRGEMGRARFWAAHSRRKKAREGTGQFDP